MFSKHFFLENKTRKSKAVKLHRISGEPGLFVSPFSDVHWIGHFDFRSKKVEKKERRNDRKIKKDLKRKK
jgi:hypothetical protein